MCLTKSGNAILSPEKSTANVRQRIKPVTNHQLTDCFFYSLSEIRCTLSINTMTVTLQRGNENNNNLSCNIKIYANLSKNWKN